MPVRPSVRPHGTFRLSLDEFSQNLIIEIFRKTVGKIQVLLKSDKYKGYRTYKLLSHLVHFFLE